MSLHPWMGRGPASPHPRRADEHGSRPAGPAGYDIDHSRSSLLAHLDDDDTPWRALRLDRWGLDLRPEGRSRAVPGTVHMLRLATSGMRLDPVPVRVDPGPLLESDPGRTSMHFVDLPKPLAGDLCCLIEDVRQQGGITPPASRWKVSETLEDPDLVRTLVRALAANGCSGMLLCGEGRWIGIRPADVQPGSPRPLRWIPDRPLVGTPRTVRLFGFTSLFEFPAEDPVLEGGQLAMAFPSFVRRGRHRDHRRVTASADLEVAFPHPLWPELEVRRPAIDLSAGGVSFRTLPRHDVLLPGLEVPVVRILRDGRPVARLAGTLQRMAPSHGSRDLVAGLDVTPLSEADALRWQATVQGLANPQARLRGTGVDAYWSLFVDSGYFRLSNCSPGDFARIRTDFDVATRRVDAAPDVGVQAVFPTPDGIAASLTTHRLYKGTWFPGQFAKRKGDAAGAGSRKILRVIQQATYEHVQHDPDLRWLMYYIHESTAWTQMCYRDWPRRHLASGDTWVRTFEAWTGACDGETAPSDGSLEFGPATDDERALLVRSARETRSWQYADALDLVPERLDMKELSDRWARAGLSRRREILVARRGGTPLAAAVLESGEPGTHPFDMYDSVRLFDLCPTGPEAHADLLRRARAWYHGQGRTTFVYCDEAGTARAAEAAGLHRLGAANLVLISRRVVPDLLEYLFEVTAPRDRMQEQQDGRVHAQA